MLSYPSCTYNGRSFCDGHLLNSQLRSLINLEPCIYHKKQKIMQIILFPNVGGQKIPSYFFN